MSDSSDPVLIAPELLRAPRLSPSRQLAMLALAAAVTGAAIWGLGQNGAGSGSPDVRLARYAAPAGAIVAIIPESDHAATEDALSHILLEPARLAELRREVGAGVTRLGIARVWDWADSDGDEVSITSAGYRQTIVISASPTLVVVPVGGDMALNLAPLRDGMGGGVTAAFSSGAGEVRVQPAPGAQDVMVALP